MARQATEQPMLLHSTARRQVLEELSRQHGGKGLTAAELAATLGLHVTTLRFHLERLVEAGMVQATFDRRSSAGRPSKRYAVATHNYAHLAPPQPYQELAALLAAAWPRAPHEYSSPEEAGHRWAAEVVTGDRPQEQPATTSGGWLAKVGSLVDLLRGWGFVPELRTTVAGRTVEVTLAACPYAAVAAQHPEVVCAAHKGLLRGVVEGLGEPDVDVEIQPFVEPGICRARLTTRAAFTTGGTR